ncbi:MAG: DNA-binding transcriptional ArsR family regulator [Halobacteriales archaeon]
MSSECDEDELLALLEDEYARAVLSATSAKPMSVETLSEQCKASESTIYRRINRLEDQDLVAEQTRIDPEGHHYSVYESRVRNVEIEFEDGETRIDLERRVSVEDDPADRFTKMWEDL